MQSFKEYLRNVPHYSKMLMGVDIEGISIVVFVRVLNMLHYIVQGKTSKRIFFAKLELFWYEQG